MISISHWGMFDAKNIAFVHWPLLWANSVDCLFELSTAETAATFDALK